jgi:hypothetical protein
VGKSTNSSARPLGLVFKPVGVDHVVRTLARVLSDQCLPVFVRTVARSLDLVSF